MSLRGSAMFDRRIKADDSPEWAGLFSEVLSLQRRPLNLHRRFGRFLSALKIPFPRNGDFGSTPARACARSAMPACS